MGIFYDFDETEADEEYEAWFKKNYPIRLDIMDPRAFNHFRYNDVDTTLLEQAKALGQACRASIVSECEKQGLTEDDIEFNDIRVR